MRRPSSRRAAASSARSASRPSRSRTRTTRRPTGASAMSASGESASIESASVAPASGEQASAELVCVPPDEVARLWPHIAHYIARAMARGGMGRFADVEADVLGANAYLWLALRADAILAAAVTKVTGEGASRLCTIVACGGND